VDIAHRILHIINSYGMPLFKLGLPGYGKHIPMEKQDFLTLYKKMLDIRTFEEKVKELYAAGRIPGFLHLSIGQEAVAVGICSNLRDDDYLLSTHRGHGRVIAKGAPLKNVMAEIFGKRKHQ
jgi:TPP-dependent pyruvate/acetoin dehydrogenase alpha subunit